jgi:hypothetical protein
MDQPKPAPTQSGNAPTASPEWARRPFAWIAIAVGGLILTELVLWVAGEESYPASEAAWWSIVALGGWGIHHYRVLFEDAFAKLLKLTAPGRKNDADVAKLVAEASQRIFTLRSPVTLLPIITVLLLWWWQVYELDPPFDSGFVNLLSFLFFIPMVVFGVWGSVVDIGAVVAVRRAAAKDLQAPFSVARHQTMDLIETGWAAAGSVIVLVYLALLTAFWLGPYSLTNELIWWLVVFALFPIFWFLVGTVQIHTMLTTIKRQHLDLASARVEKLSAALTADAQQATLQDLDTAMDIEAKVQAKKEWPSGFAGFPTFALSLAPMALQVAVIAFDLGEPV